MALRRVLGPIVVVALISLTPSPARGSGSIESQVFSMINGSRSSPLAYHSGLASAARMHSQHMSMSGGLNHDNADARVANAPPDPAEGNGAPDDGFAVAAWCENVTYSTGHPASEVPRRLYEQWRRSASHNGCMTNPNKNVGAVGVYYDGSAWWATFIAEVDRTPPGGRPAPQPTARPTQAPPPAQQAPPPAATAPPHDAPPPGGGAAAPTNVVPGPAQSVIGTAIDMASDASRPRTQAADPGEIVVSAPLSDYRISLGPTLSGSLRRVRHSQAAVSPPLEVGALAAIAMFAYRRIERRSKPRRLRRANGVVTEHVVAVPDQHIRDAYAQTV